MSAQAGIWNMDGLQVDNQLLINVAGLLKQQGPDGGSSWVGDSIAMLYFPFHTTAESRREIQPLISRRGFVFTWDGRLDNREELIAALNGDLERDPTDAAILAAAFDRWETASFRRIVGDWAVSVWRPHQRELLFATDYMAIRHIFYWLEKPTIRWSTDIAPLVLFSPRKLHIDDEYIAGYFAHDPEAYVSPYQEIRQVPPGHLVRIRHAGATIERYWRFEPRTRIRYKTDTDYEEHFRHVLRQSVRRRLRSDCPILAELSGGLDSSSIVCLADDILAKEGALAPRLDTLSYYDATEPSGDDCLYFPKIEEKRGRSGWHIDVSKLPSSHAGLEPQEFAAVPGSLGYGRELEAERATVVSHGGYRAVLSGIGGDEFLGGIPNASPQLADLIVQLKFKSLAAQLMAWGLVKRRPWIRLLWQAILELVPASLSQHFSSQARVERWIEAAFARRAKLSVRLLDVREHFGFWLPSRRACAGGVVLMQNKMAKARRPVLALEEFRYPYLDQTLIEFVLAIPASQLLRPGERRSLMRRALAEIVPQDVLSRRTKQFGARTPVVALQAHWGQIHAAFGAPLSSTRGYVDRMRFLEALQASKNGQSVHMLHLLRTISLELWLADMTSRGLITEDSEAPLEPGAEPARARW
jgi:asparagine synthase (glutamine-hydrolysing)